MNAGNDVLMGAGGSPVAKFETVGQTWSGKIVSEPVAYQVTDFQTKTPKTYPSGDPIMGVKVEIQTDVRDPAVEDDDGRRRIFLDGKRIKEAVRDAVVNAGATGLAIGGTLTVTYTGDGTPASRGVSAPKLYAASYTPPAAAALTDPWAPAPAATPPPAPQPATTTPAAPANSNGVDAGALAAALANLDPQQRAALGLPAA